MKLLLTGALSMSLFALSAQTTQSNGVVVNEAIGVEGKVVSQPTIATSEIVPISKWTIEACLDAKNILAVKMKSATEESMPIYQDQLLQINDRIKELNSFK